MKPQKGPIILSALLVLAFLALSSPLNAFNNSSNALVQDADRKVVLTVQVHDKAGKEVSMAHVIVYQENRTASSLVTRPADYQHDTDARGIARLEILVKKGQALGITIEVSREDMQTETREVDLENFPARLPPEKFVLSPRASAQTGLPSTNIKVTVNDVDGPLLEGALVNVSSGAWTPSVRNTPHEKYTGPDGSATLAVEMMSASAVERFSVTVSKPGYKEFKRVVEVNNKWGKAVGTTTEIEPVELEKAPAGTGAIEVKVTVLDSETNNGVSEADVILDGPEYKTATTNASGVVTLSVKKTGSYVVRLSQDNYWPAKDTKIHVLDTGAAPEPFHLIRKPKKDAAGDTIEVTVLAQEHADTKDKPRPLKNASVSDGRQTTMTDAGGKATLRGAYALDHAVTVTADNYEPSTQRVRIMTPMLSAATGRATFILKPALSDNTPIRLIVEVVDDLGNPVPGAGVEFFQQGRSLYLNQTNEKGERDFRSSDTNVPLAELRKGITLDVSIGTKKVVENRQVPANLLEPSIMPGRFQVVLTRDWSELRKAIAALEEKVFGWKSDLSSASAAKTKGFIDTAVTARRRAETLEKEISGLADATISEKAAAGVSICGQAAPFQLNIRTQQSQAKQKAGELQQKLDEATTKSQICSTAADAEQIRSKQREAIRLLAEIGSLHKQAAKDRDALLTIAKTTEFVRAVIKTQKRGLEEMRQLEITAMANEREAFEAYAQDAQRSKKIISTQLTLKAELAVLSVKAEEGAGAPADLMRRLTTMESILTSTNNNYSHGTRPAQDLPEDVRDAAKEIGLSMDRASKSVSRLESQVCNIATLDDAVSEINVAFENSTLEVALAADLPKLADACVAKAATKNPKTDADKPVFDPPVKDNTDPSNAVDPTGSSGGSSLATGANQAGKGVKGTTNNPTQSTDPSSSGGFWDAAKKGKQDVVDKATNTSGNKKPGANKPGPTVENRTGNSSNPANNSSKSNTPLTVEEIPESTNTTTASNKNKPNKPAPTVEEIPENTSTKVAANKPAGKPGNKPPVVEEIPESASPNVASNRPRANTPQVEEIPETSTNNPPAAGASGGQATNSPRSSGTNQPKTKPKKEKKPRDPNKPSIWTLLGGAAREAITGQPNPGNQGGNTGGDGGSGGGGGLNLAGTWNVTTQSSGDEEMQQNWTRTNTWQIWNLGGGQLRVRQVINGQAYDENYTSVDDGGGRFRLIGSNPDGSQYQMSGTYNQSQFSVSSSKGQHRVVINGTRQ